MLRRFTRLCQVGHGRGLDRHDREHRRRRGFDDNRCRVRLDARCQCTRTHRLLDRCRVRRIARFDFGSCRRHDNWFGHRRRFRFDRRSRDHMIDRNRFGRTPLRRDHGRLATDTAARHRLARHSHRRHHGKRRRFRSRCRHCHGRRRCRVLCHRRRRGTARGGHAGDDFLQPFHGGEGSRFALTTPLHAPHEQFGDAGERRLHYPKFFGRQLRTLGHGRRRRRIGRVGHDERWVTGCGQETCHPQTASW